MTPRTTIITETILEEEKSFPCARPKAMVAAGTRERITWLKFTDTCRRETLPMAMLREKITEKRSTAVRWELVRTLVGAREEEEIAVGRRLEKNGRKSRKSCVC